MFSDRSVTEEHSTCVGEGGRSVPVAVSSAPLTDAEGKRLGAVLVLRDRTEIERLREELSRNQRLAALGELAAGVAHEIRNPLSAMRGLVQYLKSKFAPGGPEADYAQVIIGEIDRMSRVVGGLLNFARPKEPEFEPTDLNHLVEHALTLIGDEARTNHIAIAFDPAADLGPVPVDPDQVTQVLLNLLVNAVEAMTDPEAEGRPRRLEVTTRADDGWVEVRVADTGAGIDPQNLTRLFDPFFTTKKKGSGLGLATSHRIVENHGGTLRAHSEPGAGTEFILRLPLAGPDGISRED